MRVRITAGFCALISILGWISPVLCVFFLIGILVHELGHLMALKLCRVSVDALELRCCGAMIRTAWMDCRRELICALAGPVCSLVFGVAVLRSVPELGLISLGLTVVNLLPLYPMDGGRILRAALMSRCREETAERIVHWTMMGTCLLLMVLACWGAAVLQAGLWPIFAALVLLWRADGKEKQLLFSGTEDKIKKQERNDEDITNE